MGPRRLFHSVTVCRGHKVSGPGAGPFMHMLSTRVLIAAACLTLCLATGCDSSTYGGSAPAAEPNAPVHHQRLALWGTRSIAAPQFLKHREGWPPSLLVGARRSVTPNGTLWLVIGPRQSACIFAGTPPASSCAPEKVANRRGLTLGIVMHPGDLDRRYFLLFGATPEGRRSVEVKMGSSVRRVPVHRGVFSVRSAEPVVEL